MSLNLISDPWIPVRLASGTRRVIAPWQMADPDIAFPDWPRADLNIACLELLIGLVFMADPPSDEEDWEDRQAPDPDRLKTRLDAFAPAFDLLGDGPRFMQDAEVLDAKPKPLDILFIDHASDNAQKLNSDLMVWRNRYPKLDLGQAAMALYAAQAMAPGSGPGVMSSMRGGGPMVTLVDPGQGLWPLIWANVPDGRAATLDDLPWMRRHNTTVKQPPRYLENAHPVEAFFGTPRRFWLVADATAATGLHHKRYGLNYEGWIHPLTPYFCKKAGEGWLPKHPKPGAFGYRHWLGVVAAEPEGDESLTRRAEVLRKWPQRAFGRAARVIVAGWAMDPKSIAKPLDFIFATPPLVSPEGASQLCLVGMVQAADQLSLALRASLQPVLAEGEAREAEREAFYARTEAEFERLATGLTAVNCDETARDWLAHLRAVALDLFQAHALPGLSERDAGRQKAIVDAHGQLRANLAGQGSYGRKAFQALSLPPPDKGSKRNDEVTQ